MFAPYCASCGTRRLLGFGRLVASDWERGGTLYIRCTCGDVIDANAQPPRPERNGHSAAHAPGDGRGAGSGATGEAGRAGHDPAA